MSTEGSGRAIVAALSANLGIAVAKFVGFAITGSSSMLAEGVHSVADSGNQLLLLVGRSRSRRTATPEHPFGYGRDRYFYAFVVALVIFSLGSIFAFYEGIHKLMHPEKLDSPAVAVIILLVAMCLEGFSLHTAAHESRPMRGGSSWLGFVRRSKSPELPVVLLEDLGALIGLVFALLGVGLASLTGNPRWDAVGTLAIGALLGCIAVVLMIETKSLLIGESATPDAVDRIRAALTGDGIDRVIHMRTMHLGPDELLVAAKVAIARTTTLDKIAAAIDHAERRVREAEPIARVIYLEPDLDRHPDRRTHP